MKHKIMDLSTAENMSYYINGIDFQEKEITVFYADGTKQPVLHPTEENILYYRKCIEEQIKEVLYTKKLEKSKKLLASGLSMLGSSLIMCTGLYFSGTFMKEKMLQLIFGVLCMGANMVYLYSQGKRIDKILSVQESLRAYELFFTYQEKYEKDFNIHIENVYELGFSHMMALIYMENDIPKEDRGSIFKLNHQKKSI